MIWVKLRAEIFFYASIVTAYVCFCQRKIIKLQRRDDLFSNHISLLCNKYPRYCKNLHFCNLTMQMMIR